MNKDGMIGEEGTANYCESQYQIVGRAASYVVLANVDLIHLEQLNSMECQLKYFNLRTFINWVEANVTPCSNLENAVLME